MLDFLRLRHHRLHDFPSSGTDWRAHGLAKAGHERHVWRAVAIVFGAAVLLVTALFFTLLLAPLPLNTVSPRLERQLAAAGVPVERDPGPEPPVTPAAGDRSRRSR